MNNLVAKVLDDLVTEIENGTNPWHKSWSGSAGMPVNATTKREYRGMNVLALWLKSNKMAYASNEWATYKQWGGAGHYVKEGEKGTPILYYRTLEKEQTNGDVKQIPMLRVSWVFNAAQVKGYEPAKRDPVQHEQRHMLAGAWWTTRKIVVGQGAPSYVPFLDVINMPDASTFDDLDEYWCTLFHEAVHWTGHKTRLNRTAFGEHANKSKLSEEYALEELVAEIGAAFVSAHFGIYTTKNSGAYLRDWLRKFADKRITLMTAARLASEAFTYLNPTFEEHRQQEAA